MLIEQLPHCPFCHKHDFKPGGSRLGGTLVQQGFSCENCLCFVQYITMGRAGCILTFIDRGACLGPNEYDSYIFPKPYTEYVDKVLNPAWRAREEALEVFDTKEWVKWLKDVFYPAFPDLKGYVPKDYPGGNSPFTDGTISYHDCPPEAQALHDNQFYGGDRNSIKQRGTYLTLPPEFMWEVYPPQAPRIPGVKFMVPYQGGWEPLNYNFSAALSIPEDPILRRNREFFTDVFNQLNTLIFPTVASETKNGYGGIEPWYTFTLKGTVFTVGWRKRVVSIKVEVPPQGEGIPTEAIRTLATIDNTTYIAHGPERLVFADEFEAHIQKDPRFIGGTDESIKSIIEGLVTRFREDYPNGQMMRLEGGWQSDLPVAHVINVHAWGKEKTIEYLKLLCNTVIAMPRIESNGHTNAGEPYSKPCHCHKCQEGLRFRDRWAGMVLCPTCGNKRCPKASDHELACSNSNEPGQAGSIY